MQPTRKLWQWLGVVFVLSFAALGWLGRLELIRPPRPFPRRSSLPTARLLYTG